MKLVSLSGLSLVVVLTVGCKTSAQYTVEEEPLWTRPGASSADFAADRKACVDYVELALYEESWVSPFRRMSGAERAIEARWWAEREYLRCMHKKDWQLAEGARVGAPPDIYYP